MRFLYCNIPWRRLSFRVSPLILLCLCSSPVGATRAPAEVDVDSPVKRHPVEQMLINARTQHGTMEDLRELGPLKFTGMRRLGRKEQEVTGWWAPPNRLRLEFKERVRGRELITIESGIGNEVWRQSEGEDDTPEARRLSREEVDEWWLQAPFPGVHAFLEEAMPTTFRGTSSLLDRDVFLLRRSRPGDRADIFLYVDQIGFYVLRYGPARKTKKEEESPHAIDDQDVLLAGVERAGNLLVPTHLQYVMDDQIYGSLRIQRFQRLTELEDSFFLPREKAQRWVGEIRVPGDSQ